MYKQDFYFELPEELIAQYPLKNRRDSRLLTFDAQSNALAHRQFKELPELLKQGDLLVLNNSKVLNARIFGRKASGGRVELLIERLHTDRLFLAQIRASKSPKPKTRLFLDKDWSIEILAKEDDLYLCQSSGDVEKMLDEIGHVPLPPYITRQDAHFDTERYQTVYALHKGSVAAPTAGLHFDQLLMNELHEKGININYVTLHVGAGTFKPVRCETIVNHTMHSEQFIVSESLANAVNRTRASGGRVIAVGTTALRSLESAVVNNELIPCERETNIFIYPGYQFKLCDGLITNFHLPESTLIMLVSALIGHSQAMAVYQEAIAQKYRFFSYGDASLLFRDRCDNV